MATCVRISTGEAKSDIKQFVFSPCSGAIGNLVRRHNLSCVQSNLEMQLDFLTINPLSKLFSCNLWTKRSLCVYNDFSCEYSIFKNKPKLAYGQ